jgi:pSer/pThr/pTyr-binding forkhead associated (FHA) protein
MADIVRINIKAGDEMGKSFDLSKNINVIGRDPGSDIVIDNIEISRRHLVIKNDAGKYYAEDQDSTNGSFLNGKRLRKPKEISNGDLITLGESNVLEFLLERIGEEKEPSVEKGDELEEVAFGSDVPQHAEERKTAKPKKFADKNKGLKPVKEKSIEDKTDSGRKLNWKIILLVALAFVVIFCVIPFVVVEVTNQWCNLFAGFFNSMSPGVCP